MTSPTRALNIARSSRKVAKLDVMSQTQASNLVKFSRHTKLLGNGLAVIDFGSRIGNIHNAYQTGDEWDREMFTESISFAASAVAGTLTVNAGIALIMAATPVGWVGLIIAGVAVAGASAGASMAANYAFKQNSGSWYDSIMKWITEL